MLDENITIVSYDPLWTELFAAESKKIKNAIRLGEIYIEHIGSTAVSGMAAKPVIDIQIGIISWNLLSEVITALSNLKYEYFEEAGVPGRHYFRKRGEQAYNVHVVLLSSNIWIDNITIRNYLRRDSGAAEEYRCLKAEALKKGIITLLAYSDYKSGYMRELLGKAKGRGK